MYLFDNPQTEQLFVLLAYDNWYSVDKLRKLTTYLSTVYFPVCEARVQALAQLSSILAPAPFSLHNRYPASSLYIPSTNATLATIISQIVTALCYKDRLAEKASLSSPSAELTSNSPSYLAARASYFNAVLQLTLFLSDPNVFFDQFTFESTLQITWV